LATRRALHRLQDLHFSRVGGHELLGVVTRVIAAANRDLEESMARGEFRTDLYYRLNVVEITVPPLRERREEIPELASRFLARFNSQYRRQKQLMPETLARLTGHPWPGNVRELENVIRRLVVLGDSERPIEALMTRGRTGTTGTARRRDRPSRRPASERLDGAGRKRPSATRSWKCSVA
jgi:DNA-binding NtrC family response regulator